MTRYRAISTELHIANREKNREFLQFRGNSHFQKACEPNDFEAFQPNSLNIGTRKFCERTGNFGRHSGNFQRPREEPAMPVGPFVNRRKTASCLDSNFAVMLVIIDLAALVA